MKSNMRYIVFVILLFTLFFRGESWALSGPNQVELDGDKLSVHVEGMALGELLMTVSKKTGIKFGIGDLEAKKKISIEFNTLPLSDALRRIVAHLSSAMIYDASGEIDTIYVFGKSTTSAMMSSRKRGDDATHNLNSYLVSDDSQFVELHPPEELVDEQEQVSAGPPDLEFSVGPIPEDVIIE